MKACGDTSVEIEQCHLMRFELIKSTTRPDIWELWETVDGAVLCSTGITAKAKTIKQAERKLRPIALQRIKEYQDWLSSRLLKLVKFHLRKGLKKPKQTNPPAQSIRFFRPRRPILTKR